MLLQQKDSGKTIDFTLRAARSEDAPKIISCIRDAYGDTYVKPFLYSPEGIIHHQQSGEMCFSVAETPDGDIAGITACEYSEHFPGLGEIACQVVCREYNGFGLALPLACHSMHQAQLRPLSGQFARALGCHLISQKTLDGMGFTACGFLLNVFDKTRFLHRYQNGDYAKIPQSVAVKRQDKTHGGSIWLPAELQQAARNVYEGLGLPYTLRESDPAPSHPGRWDEEYNEAHGTLTLWSRQCGSDFASYLDQRLSALSSRPGQTVNLYLNLSLPGCAAAYAAARQMGFLFTGFLPCGGDGEYLILHHPLSLPVNLDNIPHIPQYAPILAQIRRQLCQIL